MPYKYFKKDERNEETYSKNFKNIFAMFEKGNVSQVKVEKTIHIENLDMLKGTLKKEENSSENIIKEGIIKDKAIEEKELIDSEETKSIDSIISLTRESSLEEQPFANMNENIPEKIPIQVIDNEIFENDSDFVIIKDLDHENYSINDIDQDNDPDANTETDDDNDPDANNETENDNDSDSPKRVEAWTPPAKELDVNVELNIDKNQYCVHQSEEPIPPPPSYIS